jgi:hypothetical protein
MQQEYAKHGVRFRYPAEWEVSEEREGSQVAITVSSPNTAFWMVTLLADRPDPEETVAAVLDTFEEEYDELDVYPVTARVCERGAVARDVDFVCLELLNMAFIRAFRTERFTVVVLYQGTDGDLEELQTLLEQITRSLSVTAGAEADDPDDVDLEEEDSG